jgi:hypothetical protein
VIHHGVSPRICPASAFQPHSRPITRQSRISKTRALAGPKRGISVPYSEPKSLLTRTGARTQDNRDSGRRGRVALRQPLGDGERRDSGMTNGQRRGSSQVFVANGVKTRTADALSVGRLGSRWGSKGFMPLVSVVAAERPSSDPNMTVIIGRLIPWLVERVSVRRAETSLAQCPRSALSHRWSKPSSRCRTVVADGEKPNARSAIARNHRASAEDSPL